LFEIGILTFWDLFDPSNRTLKTVFDLPKVARRAFAIRIRLKTALYELIVDTHASKDSDAEREAKELRSKPVNTYLAAHIRQLPQPLNSTGAHHAQLPLDTTEFRQTRLPEYLGRNRLRVRRTPDLTPSVRPNPAVSTGPRYVNVIHSAEGDTSSDEEDAPSRHWVHGMPDHDLPHEPEQLRNLLALQLAKRPMRKSAAAARKLHLSYVWRIHSIHYECHTPAVGQDHVRKPRLHYMWAIRLSNLMLQDDIEIIMT
jgi:hypothetical protein